MIGLRKKVEEQQKEAAAAAAAPTTTEQAAGTPGSEAKDVDMKDASAPGAPAAAGTPGSEAKDVGMKDASAPGAPAAAPVAGGRGRGISILGVKKDGAPKGTGGRRLRPGEIRVQKDVSDLDGGDCATPNFPNLNDLMNFEVSINSDKGYWGGYVYNFSFAIPDMYPHEPPKVRCLEKIYHPNIDLQGNVCLNILRADWKPVLDLNAVIYGLIVLFESPNPDDPLNHDAAKCLRENPAKFKQNVERSLRGMDVDGVPFPAARKGDRKARS